MTKLVIFGIGKIGQVALHHFRHDSGYQVAGFVVDKQYVTEARQYDGLPLVDFAEAEKHFDPAEHHMFVAVGYHGLNQMRRQRCEQARAKGYRLANYISSDNKHISNAMLGDNNFIMSGEPLQPKTRIGSGCFIWTNALVGHHSQLGDYCWVTSGVVIGGNCRIGDHCFLGLNATIGHEVTVGKDCLIGAGALISKDAQEGGVYIAAETARFRLTSQQFLKMNTLQ
ncbi:MAG: acetyltransferase [Alphaproteobacteria bacterium]